MKIYNTITLDWDGGVLEEESFEYDGPLAKCDMGGDVPTQTTSSSPWVGQEKYLRNIFKDAAAFYNEGGPELFPDPMTAARDSMIGQGEQGILDYIFGPQFGQAGEAAGGATLDLVQDPYGAYGYDELTSDPSQYGIASPESDAAIKRQLSGDPFSNPNLQNVVDAYTQDIMESWERDIAPGIRTAQISYQPGGSSRGELVNARAEDDLMENIGNFTTNTYFDAYNRALNDQQYGLNSYFQQAGLGEREREARAGEGLSRFGAGVGGYGDLTGTALSGYSAPIQIGTSRQAQTQAEIDEEAFRFDYDQNRDYYNLQDYMNIVQGNFGGQQSTSYDAGVSDLQRGLGTGGGLLSMLGAFAI